MKVGFDWPGGLREKIFENGGYIHVYSPGTRADKHPGDKFDFSLTQYSVN